MRVNKTTLDNSLNMTELVIIREICLMNALRIAMYYYVHELLLTRLLWMGEHERFGRAATLVAVASLRAKDVNFTLYMKFKNFITRKFMLIRRNSIYLLKPRGSNADGS